MADATYAAPDTTAYAKDIDLDTLIVRPKVGAVVILDILNANGQSTGRLMEINIPLAELSAFLASWTQATPKKKALTYLAAQGKIPGITVL